MLRFDIITIFPDFFRGVFDFGIVRRARAGGLVEVAARDLRDWQQGPQWASFEPLTYREFEHRQTVTRADAVARVASFSYIASLDEARREEVLARVDGLLAGHGVTEYEQRWRCDLYVTKLRNSVTT